MAEVRLYMDDELYDASRLGIDIPSAIDDEKLLCQVTPGDRSNALHVAARFGNERFLSAVLARNNPSFQCELLCKLNSKGETPLHLAARFGHMDTVRTLLSPRHDGVRTSPLFSHKKKPCWRERDHQGDTPLHVALKYGHQDIAQLLIKQDMQLLSLDNNAGESPAYLVADKFCSDFLLTILNDDRDNQFVSFSGPFGQTALHPARKLPGDIMSILIQRGKHLLKVQDNKGKTVLHYAVEEKRESMVETLLQKDRSLAYLHDNDGFTPLHRAANMGSFAMVETILALSPQSIEIREQSHAKTALHFAKLESCFLAQCLRKTRMKELINEVDSDGNTPLHLALIKKNLESADALLEVSGINWSITNNQGLSPMDLCESDDQIPIKMKCLASRWGGVFIHKDISKLDDVLKLKWGNSLLYRSPSGDSIHHIAAREGSMKIIRELAKDSNFSQHLLEVNYKGENPLHLAAEYGKFEVVKEITLSRKPRNWVNRHGIEDSRVVMMEKGELNQPWRMSSKNGDTPTHRALRSGHDNIALHLLHLAPELGSSSINKEDESLLYLAAENNCFNALKEICKDEGNSYSISGPNGQTPLHAAARKGGLKSVKYLSEKRPDLLNVIDDSGKTPLHYAVENEGHTEVMELLKQNKSAAFVYDKEGFTPLLRAADMGFYRCVDAILKLCPQSAELRDLSNNRTVLHLAKFPGHRLKLFMKRQNGAKWINETDGDGNTPLHSAIISADKSKENVLLETKGINLRIRNKQQQTPFDLCKNLVTDANEKQTKRYRAMRHLKRGKQSFLEYYFAIAFGRSSTVQEDESMTEEELERLLNSMAVVATLLVTITFAGLFTIPGGYDQHTGEVMRMKEVVIQLYVATDAFALFTGIGVLLKYAYAILFGPRMGRRELAAGSIVLLQYSLGATTLSFVCALYAVVSKSAIWVFVLSFAIGTLCAIIP